MRSSATTDRCVAEESPDDELIARLRRGDESALNALICRYKKRLYHFIRRAIPDDEAAYDILQETFIRLYYRVDTYDSRYTFSTWLYQIAINLCRDYARKHKQRLVSLDQPPGAEDGTYHDILAASAPNAEDSAVARQALVQLSREIQKLPHKLKTALILFAVEENSQERCAELLGVTPKTVETRVYRARKILEEHLKKFF